MFGMFDYQESEEIKEKIKIKSIKNTSTRGPSQWEGITENKETLYIRYRWGRLAIQLSEPNGTIKDAVNTGRVLYNKQIGPIYDGVITLEAVMKIMKKECIISMDMEYFTNAIWL